MPCRAVQLWVSFVWLVVLVLGADQVSQAMPAFPGAEGFGANATGGRGGEVFHVNSLSNGNTGTYEGPNGYNRGTLRWCLLSEVSSLPRTIVIDISGQITLSSQITMEGSNITLAGQTAPGQGLTTAGKPWLIESGGNLVLRYFRNRLGRNGGQDSIGVEGGTNIIFDHVTSTWSNDEAFSVAKDGNLVTVQNSFIYEGLNHSGHGYGSLIRPDIDSKVSYHHNLYAHNESRNPRPGTYNNRKLEFEFVNNVVYNWGHRAGYSGGSEGTTPEPVDMNFIGNAAIAGQSTRDNLTSAFITDDNASLRAYQSGNLIDSVPDSVIDGDDTGWGMFEVEAGSLTQMGSPFAFTGGVRVTPHSAEVALDSVLDYGGSFWWNRDFHDNRVANSVATQTGTIVNHENDVGGFMPPASEARTIATWDSDYDGMPNHWEAEHGLNPNSSPDRNGDYDNDGYTNLEEYLNYAGAWPALRPITWAGGNGRFALNQNWDTWQPSQYDEAHIDNGTATIDAIGQRAGTVRIGTHAGDNATLAITGGWLKVAEQVYGPGSGEVVIGAHPSASATLNLSGGKLDVQMLSRGDSGVFNFTGGTLHADTVAFDLVNNGGTLAPGHSVGQTHVMGDLTMASGTFQIELAADLLSADSLVVDGLASLGGALSVVPLGQTPQNGQSWRILTAENIVQNFASITPGYSVQKQGNELWLFVGAAPVLTGDYNDDGVVDAGDYVRWRNALAGIGTLENETESHGVVNELDYAAWKNNYGAPHNGSGGIAHVPEPAAFMLILWALVPFARRWSRSGPPVGCRA